LGWWLLAQVVAYAAAITASQYGPFPGTHISDAIANLLVAIIVPAVLCVAVMMRRCSLRDYFALEGFSIRDFGLGAGFIILIFVAFIYLPFVFLDIKNGSNNRLDYQIAQLGGTLPLLWLNSILVAPVSEELVFRGFLHRGWSASRLGITGSIFLTSALWALLHQQYNWIGILAIFSMGLAYGWLRQRSGSTALTIALHALNNLIPMAAVSLT
jgi:membrane protease YdiL (CAAX protease family)